jgi:CDP-paratose 2-epimerase
MNISNSTNARRILITGGAGFIGTNVADRLLEDGAGVIIYDNLSRDGVERNLSWLVERHGSGRVEVIKEDVRNSSELERAVHKAQAIYHFAAQVAVTTSIIDPLDDFDVNARGTLNLLEIVRETGREIPLLFTSTNKVYGDLIDVDLEMSASRYLPPKGSAACGGIDETRAVHFHSPYGCSKGAADQYVLDYAHTFGLPATVFRMSCIYGPHQFGTEDQGWVAHFIRKALRGEAITLYGDGRQVRDILFVDDLVQAMVLALEQINRTRGQAFNIGGGPRNTISLLELLEMIGGLRGRKVKVSFERWRAADQRYYVSDTRHFQETTGWRPEVSVREGVLRLHDWLADQYGPVDRLKLSPAAL